ncbi:unnamed protein product, partial [Mesorhabditis spiculigera]
MIDCDEAVYLASCSFFSDYSSHPQKIDPLPDQSYEMDEGPKEYTTLTVMKRSTPPHSEPYEIGVENQRTPPVSPLKRSYNNLEPQADKVRKDHDIQVVKKQIVKYTDLPRSFFENPVYQPLPGGGYVEICVESKKVHPRIAAIKRSPV